MKSRDNRRSRRTRYFRIEQLETRHMLSADGFSIDFKHDHSLPERSQASRPHELDLARNESEHPQLRGVTHSPHQRRGEIRSLQQHGAIDSPRELQNGVGPRDIEHVRSQPDAGRPPKHDPHLQAAGIRPIRREILLTINASLSVEQPIPVSFEPISFEPISFEPISRPSTLPAVRSEPVPPATATSSPTDAPSIRKDESPSAAPTAERATTVAAAQADAIQLVSIRSHDVDFDDTASVDAIGSELKKIADGLPSSSFQAGSRRFDHAVLDHWLSQSERVANEFSRLDELLDAIVSERTNFSFPDNSNRPRLADSDRMIQRTASPTPESIGSEGMILLLPGTSIVEGSAQIAAQIFDEIDDSEMGQWSVGIGFYHVLEVVGHADFAERFMVASGPAFAGVVAGTASIQRHEPHTPSSQRGTESSPRKALGVMFCCLGIQYLRQRRKQPVSLEGDVGV